MRFNELIKLPEECKKLIFNEIKEKNIGSLKKLFDLVKRNGKLGIKYSLATSNNFQPSKLPTQVWKDKSGHCYELCLFLLTCLKHLKFEAYYCEMPDFKYGDHSCVGVKLQKNFILLDPARDKFKARYKKYRKLNEIQTIGNYYVNCAFMFYPEWGRRVSKKEKIKLAKKSIRYAKLGLKYDSKSKRAKDIIESNLKFLENK